MREQTPEEIKTDRDALLQVTEGFQKRAQTAERIIQLLLVAGFVTQKKVDQATKLAEL